MSESFAELLEENISYLQMRAGSIIDGTVVGIRPDSVVVSAGLKSECFIPAEQFTGPDGKLEVEVGDTAEAQTHPTPVSYTHLTLPTILLV